MAEQKEWPKTWDKCPVCGCTERVGKSIKEELAEKGLWRQEIEVTLFPPSQVLIFDPAMLSKMLTIPVLNRLVDQCANPECGNIYTFFLDLQWVPASKLNLGGGMIPPKSPPFSKS